MIFFAIWIVMTCEMVAAVPPGSTVWAAVAFRCWLQCDHHRSLVPRYSDHQAKRLSTPTRSGIVR
jgi:hypothetical protein